MRNKFILFIIILMGLSGLLGFWYYQKNIYSKEILKLEILGPAEADLAQKIEYVVKYKNQGNVRLEESQLIFEYPEHSILEKGQSRREKITLENIYPGEEKSIYFQVRLLGKAGEIKKARAWLSYRPKNLKARYESETSHTLQIKNIPLNLEFDLPSKIESGKKINFRLNYFSNVNYPLSNLEIRMEYPSEFEFESSSPSALEESQWEIGLLNKAEGGRIEIVGKLGGEVGQEKVFRAELGSWQEGEFVLLKEALRAVEIVVPSLYISQEINNHPQYIASPGDTLHYEIFFKNIGQEDLANLFLVVKLEGEPFDFFTLKAPLADFELGDNSLIFDWRRVPNLRFLGAQQEGKVEFWIKLKEDWPLATSAEKKLVIRNKVYLSQAQEEFVTKVNSKLEIAQKGYYQDEIFGNFGPLPPRVGETTTYTIIWQAKNYYNPTGEVKVRATLGQGVKLTGNIFPEGANLTFDSFSREVVWKIGQLAAGQGVLDSPPQVAFQIAFTPKFSQKGEIPQLVGQALIRGEDNWTEAILESRAPAITTALPDDPTTTLEEGIVQ